MSSRDRSAGDQPDEGQCGRVAGREVGVPRRFRMVDLTVAAACRERFTQHGIAGAVKSRRGKEIGVGRNHGRRSARQDKPGPEDRYGARARLSHGADDSGASTESVEPIETLTVCAAGLISRQHRSARDATDLFPGKHQGGIPRPRPSRFGLDNRRKLVRYGSRAGAQSG